MSETLSVVTPSYNQGRFIRATIESVLQQGVDVEYVVMDGGSTDETVSILRAYEGRLRWVSEPDRGQAHAVNKGIRATQGSIIGWLNSDDVYLPGALARVRAYFETHPACDVVYGEAWHIDEEGRPFERYPTEPWNLERLKEVCFLSQPAVFFRRRVVERFGLLDESLQYCMDYEYWLRLGLGGARFCHLPEFLAGSRLYAANKTLGQRLAVHREINDMLKRRLGRVPDRWLFNYAHIWAESHGLDREKSPARFIWSVVRRSVWAAWHWNRRISPAMALTLARWTAHAARLAWRSSHS